MLADLFVGKNGVPSPPSIKRRNSEMKIETVNVEMSIQAVDCRMAKLTNRFDRASLTEETYTKLAYAIGKDLDLEIIGRQPNGDGNGRKIFMSLLDTTTGVGERFDAIYRSDGDEFFSQPAGKQNGWHMEFLQMYLPEYRNNNSKSYTIFTDRDHGNLEFFDREQLWGNCHLQAPILLQWYLTLWQNANLSADKARIIDLSKYIRNAFSSPVLYNYIVEEKGEVTRVQARRIMPEAFGNEAIFLSSPRRMTFDSLTERLKERGPAIAEMPTLKQSFLDDINDVSRGGSKRQFVLEGTSTGEEIGGHGLLLVGLHEKATLEGPQLYLLLQNWWKGKPFISVHLDYFLACGGELVFSNGDKVEPVTDTTYTKLTESIRCAVSSPHLEKGATRVRRYLSGPVSSH